MDTTPLIQIIIGSENPWPSLRNYSLIVARYGLDDAARGVIGVVGPTRMNYSRAISSVRYVGELMSQLWGELNS